VREIPVVVASHVDMKIFLSHRGRDKALVREFKRQLPAFLHVWLDEESLVWGGALTRSIRASIQTDVDFLLIFLDADALKSDWVRTELAWALEREVELDRTFVLPILLEAVPPKELPAGLSDRLWLSLGDQSSDAVESLARQATTRLLQLVIETYSAASRGAARSSLVRELSLLSEGQSRILKHVQRGTSKGGELTESRIRSEMRYEHARAELYYRLETLVLSGFLAKQRASDAEEWRYSLSDAYRSLVGG
jgi:hypothetical protein